MGGQGTKWHRNIAENLNRLSTVHERYRRQTDGRRHIAIFTFAKNSQALLLYGYPLSSSTAQPAVDSTQHTYGGGRFWPSCGCLRAKTASASGGLRPLTQSPWTPLGAPPPYPRYRLALPRSPCPLTL